MKKLLVYLIILFLLFNLIFVINPLLTIRCIEKTHTEVKEQMGIKIAFSKKPCPGLFEGSYRIVEETIILPHKKEMMNFYGGYMEKINKLLGKQVIYDVPPQSIYSCEQDSDCIAVSNGPCGCNSGGIDTAINKKHLDYWEKIRASQVKSCLAVINCRAEPYCGEDNLCAVNIIGA